MGVTDYRLAFLLMVSEVRTPITPENMTRTKMRLKPIILYKRSFTFTQKSQELQDQWKPSDSDRNFGIEPCMSKFCNSGTF